MANNGTWDEESFDLQKLISQGYGADFFFIYEFHRSPSGNLGFNNSWEFFVVPSDKKQLSAFLNPLDIDENVKAEAIDNFYEFIAIRESIYKNFKDSKSILTVKIKDMHTSLPQLKLDWLGIVNSKLLQRSQVTNEEEIFIENPELMGALLANMSRIDKK